MPEITKDQMVGKTVLRIESIPAAIEVTCSDSGAVSIQTFTTNGSINDVHRRVGALVDTLRRHTKTPKPLAHSLVDGTLPIGILEY